MPFWPNEFTIVACVTHIHPAAVRLIDWRLILANNGKTHCDSHAATKRRKLCRIVIVVVVFCHCITDVVVLPVNSPLQILIRREKKPNNNQQRIHRLQHTDTQRDYDDCDDDESVATIVIVRAEVGKSVADRIMLIRFVCLCYYYPMHLGVCLLEKLTRQN